MRITQDIMFIRLSQSLPRQTCKVEAQADGVSQARLRASAKLYSGKAFGNVQAFDRATRSGLLIRAIDVPGGFRGAYVMPADMLERTLEWLTERKSIRAVLVTQFVQGEYPQEVEQARQALGPAFDPEDFPPAETLLNEFGCDWSLFKIEVPQGLPPAVRAAEEAKLHEQLEQVFLECRDAMRQSLADLIGHLTERLKPDADGSRKRLSTSTVEQLREFLDTVNARDVTSDEAIRALSDKARSIIGTYSVDDLKGPMVASRVQGELTKLKSELDDLIVKEGSRKLNLDLE